MLFAGCSNCQQIVPLHCAGLVFPHMPLEVVQTPFGVACMVCGIAPPIFACLHCGTLQHLYLHGAQLQVGALQPQGLKVAPVVQAPSGSGENMLTGLMKGAASSFATKFGEGLASELMRAFFGGGG